MVHLRSYMLMYPRDSDVATLRRPALIGSPAGLEPAREV
jgi:hypothetical protein